MGVWLWWAVLGTGVGVWLGPWAVAEAAVRCVALAGLGLGSAWGGWALGRRLYLQGGVSTLLFRAELAALSGRLCGAQSGPRRLAALRRLVAFARGPSGAGAWWREILVCCECPKYPKGLVAGLASCLLESGSLAAPLVLAFLGHSILCEGRASEADRALFFSDASLGSLRKLFLSSQDLVLDKALLRLFARVSRNLASFHWNAPWYPAAMRWAGQEQLGRHQAFLRDPGVLGKLRGLLFGGDKCELLPDAMAIYSEVVGGEPVAQPLPLISCCHFEACRSLFLLGPVLRDLIQRMGELPEASRRCLSEARFRLSPVDRPAEAAEALEGVLLPLLDQADLLPPLTLRWLLWAFPTHYDVSDPDMFALGPQEPLDCPEGRELRRKVLRGISSALDRVAGCPDLTWALLGALWDWDLWDGHNPQADPALLETSVRAIGDVGRGWRDAAVDLALTMDWSELRWQVTEQMALSGGFKALVCLLGHHGGPFTGGQEHETDAYGAKLDRLLVYALWLLKPQEPLMGLAPEVELASAVKRVLAWEQQGLEAVLRRLVNRKPEAGAYDLRPAAQDLLDEHFFLRLAQLPPIRPSAILHTHISFPLR